MPAPYQTTTQVRFAHVDGAGIVFFPRYFEFLNAAIEDWFAQSLGADFRSLHMERGVGVPTVDLKAQFTSPGFLGDDLAIQITPRTIGRSSCTYEALFTAGDRELLRVVATLVCMDIATKKSTPWPDDIRQRITSELARAG